MNGPAQHPRSYRVLVLGFGPFGDVVDNPAARLALGLNGSKLPGGGRVVGEVMRVSWDEARAHPLRRAKAIDAALVLGIGVARGRTFPAMERYGRRLISNTVPDVDGVRRSELLAVGPDELESTAAPAWAQALGIRVSEDAGRYVCNAWVWHTLHDGLPAAFLHVPDGGFPLSRLRQGVRTMARAWRVAHPRA